MKDAWCRRDGVRLPCDGVIAPESLRPRLSHARLQPSINILAELSLGPHQRGDNNRAWSRPASAENAIAQPNTMSLVTAAHCANHGSILSFDCSRDHAPTISKHAPLRHPARDNRCRNSPTWSFRCSLLVIMRVQTERSQRRCHYPYNRDHQ